jgi:hypothetical protein
MAQQGTDEKQEPGGQEGAGQEPAAEDGTGRHAAADESTEKDASAEQPAEQSSSSEESAEKSSSSEKPTEKQASGEKPAEKQASGEKPAEKQASAEKPTEKQAPSEQPTEKHETQRPGQGDTSWAEGEHAGTTRHRSVDVGELAWRTGNVLATVVRTLALLFALVLIVNVVLVLVGVNPTNGVAQFVGTVADIVILGFRNLFVPANPVAMLIVNSLIAAVFWAFVGELLSRLIRFVAARVK